MKTKNVMIKCIILLVIMANFVLSIQAQQAFYVYRNDGRINTFITTEIDSITYSRLDVDSLIHDDYVVSEIHTPDSLYRIPLAVIDSVGFVTPKTVYQPGVKVLEGELRKYILKRDDFKLFFQIDTPTSLLPSVGDKLISTEIDDILESAFAGQVSEIQTRSDCVELLCVPVDLTDIFECYYGIIRQTGDDAETSPKHYSRAQSDGFFSTGTRRFSPGEQSTDILNTHGFGISYNKDEELSYSLDNASATISLTPVIDYNAYLIINKDYGVNLSVTAIGNYSFQEILSLSGNVGLNFEFPIFHKAIPIPEALIDIEFEFGIFGNAQAALSIDQTWTQTYRHVFHWEWSNQGHESLQKVHTINNTGNSHTGKVAINGSLGVGGYGKIGIAFIATSSLDIAEIGLKYKGGISLEGTYVPYKRDEKYAKKSTDLYNQIKESEIAAYSFRSLTFEASLFKWSISKEIPNFINIPINNRDLLGGFRCVPLFEDTKLDLDEFGVYNASAKIIGEVSPTDVGFALINEDDNDDSTISYSAFDYIGPTADLFASFYNMPTANDYRVFPIVKYMGMELLAEPSATALYPEYNICPDSNHPHIIDLGLPSGTKWSCCNIGASTPTENGNYYAWGESAPKDHYFTDNNPWYIIPEDEHPRINDDYELVALMTMGAVDSSGNLVPSYDAATCSLGDSWRMPTRTEILELSRSCKWSFETINGTNGCKFVGPNGNILFLPFANEAICNVGHFGPNEECYHHYTGDAIMNLNRGCYWSSTPDCNSKNQSGQSYALQIYTGGSKQFVSLIYDHRYIGKSIRPVYK